MFQNWMQPPAVSSSSEKKSIAPTLRSDVYTAIEQCKVWMSGAAGQVGDGVSYTSVLKTIQKHFAKAKIGLAQTEAEVAVVIGGITNMILEMSKWEALAGGMAMRTWVDTIAKVHAAIPQGTKKDAVVRGIMRGINQNTDYLLLTKDFTARIQIISCLKSLFPKLYGAGSEETRQAEALLSSKLL
ncbi:hypothetical protein D9757_004869 [Collybiopsis confluens]|uniref:Uncharacterized protein n=1 Tax=Collybiopsis confluens TaxID=2823264 RepID=A0A8H5HT13_9AGAR|nr:hypothetical protein D9757_004869 [Collybiopsis confluens]